MASADGTASFASSMTAGSRSISNVVERTIRPIALNRKNALFAMVAAITGSFSPH